ATYHYVRGSDEKNAEQHGSWQGAARVAHFAADFAHVPPAAEREERAHHARGKRGAQGQRTASLFDEGHEVRPRAETKQERPENQQGKNSEFEPGGPTQNTRADAQTEDVQDTQEPNRGNSNRFHQRT